MIKLIENEEFINRSKTGSKKVFVRNRKLPFKDLIVMLSRGFKSSLQREMDDFYKQVTGSDFNIRQVTKGAFTQARANLKHEAFIELNENGNNSFY